jgi:hypothetical protein
MPNLVLVYEGILRLDSPEESWRASVIHAGGLLNKVINKNPSTVWGRVAVKYSI